jgi:hypothetical protein
MKAYANYLAVQAELHQQELLDEARRRHVRAPVQRRGHRVRKVLRRLGFELGV